MDVLLCQILTLSLLPWDFCYKNYRGRWNVKEECVWGEITRLPRPPPLKPQQIQFKWLPGNTRIIRL